MACRLGWAALLDQHIPEYNPFYFYRADDFIDLGAQFLAQSVKSAVRPQIIESQLPNIDVKFVDNAGTHVSEDERIGFRGDFEAGSKFDKAWFGAHAIQIHQNIG